MGATGSPKAAPSREQLRPRLRRVTTLLGGAPLELAAMTFAAAFAVVWALWQPPVRDMAGQLFRAQQYDAVGPSVWNNLWYGGHHTPGYSALLPPVEAVLGIGITGVIAATASAGCFAALLRRHAGAAAWPGALWLAAGTTTSLFTGRLPFAVGTAFGIGACLAVQRSRPVLGAVLGVGAGVSSGVAAAFVALAGLALAATGDTAPRRWHGLVLASFPVLTVIALGLLFPLGGDAPFSSRTLAYSIACGLAVFAAAAPTDRAVRAGALLYVAGCAAAFLVPTPLGGTAGRLGALVAGPLVLTLLLERRRAGTLRRGVSRAASYATVAVAIALGAWWQWDAVRIDVRDAVKPAYKPSTREAFYAPLIAQIERRSRAPVRVEVVFTATHYEALWVARRISIARGWLRQLDRARNPLFYDGRLSSSRYQRWLRHNGITWVALPAAPLDYSAEGEARIVRSRPSYLREVWRSANWRLFRAADSPGLASGPGRVVSLDAKAIVLEAHRPGRVLLRVRYTRYWSLASGRACVALGPSGWTEVRVAQAGRIRIVARFGSLTRLGGQRQCRSATT
jgi:hypothetical protein